MKSKGWVLSVVALCLFAAAGCASPKGSGKTGDKCEGAKTHDWHAWNDRMPMGDKGAYVAGILTVKTGGWTAALTKRATQGINPSILMLDLKVTPPSGPVTQVITDLPVQYREPGAAGRYTEANIFCGTDLIARIDFKDVH